MPDTKPSPSAGAMRLSLTRADQKATRSVPVLSSVACILPALFPRQRLDGYISVFDRNRKGWRLQPGDRDTNKFRISCGNKADGASAEHPLRVMATRSVGSIRPTLLFQRSDD